MSFRSLAAPAAVVELESVGDAAVAAPEAIALAIR
jgi:hypothetical protein